MSTRSEMKDVIKLAERNGFVRIASPKGHIVMKRDGYRITFSSSPSSAYAATNARRDLMRLLEKI